MSFVNENTCRPASRPLLVLSFALWLAGCAVGPDYQMPALAVPERWAAEGSARPAQQPALSAWWQRLGDPLLDSLIAEAVGTNLDVATSKAKIREARASYRQAGGGLLPSLDASASATRNRTGANASASGDRTYSSFQTGFDASWELDLFGGSRRGVEAALYGVEAAEEELQSTLLTLVGDIAANYVAMRGFQARSALAARTATSQHETADLTRLQFDAGASTALDVANAVGLATATEASLATFEASRAQALHRLGVLLGLDPAALAGRLGEVVPVPAPRDPIPTGVPADVLTARPDVRLAERQLAQATARIGEAEAARYPDVGLTGSISTSGSKAGEIAKGSSIGWSLGPTISLPIFNGGQLASAVEVSEAQRDQSYLALRSAVLTALEDVENAAVALTQERLRNARLTASADAYREAVRLARARYLAGTSSFLDVLDAERSSYSAEDSLIESHVEIATNYIALNKALGGGWDGAVAAPGPEITDHETGPRLRSTGRGRS